ncbi:unnamed protein product [Rotaria sp. Silwood2]|nr:unnamed protein product [Rotaria sp. Silwood2]CAF4580705.1 unnamed protein product [Rotaria sp. Silwood2]
MIGTCLEITEVTYNNNINVYSVELKVQDDSRVPEDDEEDLIEVKTQTLRENLNNCINTASKYLSDGELDDINKIFAELNELFPQETTWIEGHKQCILGKYYAYTAEDYHLALSYYEKGIKIWEQYLDDNELNAAVNIANIHRKIADIYKTRIIDYSIANKHYDYAITLLSSSLKETANEAYMLKLHELIIWYYEKKAEIAVDENERRANLLKATEYEQLKLNELSKYYPSNHPRVKSLAIYLAGLQKSLLLFEEAVKNYNKLTEICLLEDNPQYDEIAFIYRNLCEICIKWKEDYGSALDCKKKEIECGMKHHVASGKASKLEKNYIQHQVAQSHLDIADIYFKLSDFQLAHDNIVRARELYEASDYFKKQEEINKIMDKLKNIESLI